MPDLRSETTPAAVFGTAALLIACAASPLRAQDPAPALRFMTFNIRYGTAPDRSNRWENRAELVAGRIRAFRPHVLGLQEALRFQVAQLATALPELQPVGEHRMGGQRDEGCPLWIDTSRLAVEAHGTFWLGPTPNVKASRGWDAALPRICTWAVVRDRVRHGRLLVANTHFDHLGPVARLESARLISAWRRVFPMPFVLLGDFNCDEDSAPMRWLAGQKLRDSFRVLHPDRESVATFNGFLRARGGKIDAVLCSPEIAVRSAAIDATRPDGRFPSDHFPVTAEVMPPAGPAPELVPRLVGAPWSIASLPDLGPLGSSRLAGHTVWRAGTWQLWAAVDTTVGRVLCAWQTGHLTQRHWSPRGVALRADPAYGESAGPREWLDAPHVARRGEVLRMLYGAGPSELDTGQVCLASSADGRSFTRTRNALGQSRAFAGPGAVREPMVLQVGDEFFAYFASDSAILCRRSSDLVRWSAPRRVWRGSAPGGDTPLHPFVVHREGAFYLFRTVSLAPPRTAVYRSLDPQQFGRGERRKVGTLPLACAEVIEHLGRSYATSTDGRTIELVRLEWTTGE
ncbi:MAG: endonuclease/exonuclease/phosphatase family protein [Planctomycetes bacterium]|nr:endonuclease/exonuclease/phosphatase family protein [Planctomycetota bacterium]MCB9871168.1 endonuclease/exonuclease/phosphatase family protein [Planctomycetota bacterium]